MSDVAAWVASATTMIAAIMTAANLGMRITGWGFVVFAVGSVTWASVGIVNGQSSLVVTNSFLCLVNLFGVWRWLGRRARYEAGSAIAADRSRRRSKVPSLISGSSVIGATMEDCNGELVGTVIDTMIDCDHLTLSYIVVAHGGLGGAGETLRAIAPDNITFGMNSVRCNLSADQISNINSINDLEWPAVAPSPQSARQ